MPCCTWRAPWPPPGPDVSRRPAPHTAATQKELLVLQKDRRYSQTRDSLLQIYDAAQGELLNYHPAARVAVRIVHTSPGSAEAAEAVQRLRSTPLLDLYNLAASECVLDSMLSAAAGPVIADLQEGRFQGVGGALQRRVQQHLACSDPLDAVHVVHFMHGHSGETGPRLSWVQGQLVGGCQACNRLLLAYSCQPARKCWPS